MPTAKANGKTFKFPDGTTPEQMGEAIDGYFSSQQTEQPPEQRAQSVLPDAVAEGASALNRGSAGIPDFFIDAANTAGKYIPAFKQVTEPLRAITGQEGEGIPRVADVAKTISPAFGQKNFMEAGPGIESGPLKGATTRDFVQGLENVPGMALGLTQPSKTAAQITDDLVSTAQGSVNKSLRESAPTLDALKQKSDAIYKQIDDLGVTFKGSSVAALADDIERTLIKSGLDDNLTPKAAALLKRIRADSEGPLTATQLDTLRKIAQGPANDVDSIGKATADSRLGAIVINKIDDFLSAPSKETLIGKADDVGPMFTQARRLVSQRKKGELVQEAFNKASLQASGFENGLRVQFRSILGSPSKRRGFSAEEIEAMRHVVEGGKIENAARVFGKFGISLDLSGGGFLAGVTALGGIAAGGGPGGAAAGGVVALASAAKQAARVMTQNNAALADATIRAGKNGRKIVAAYLRNTPKSKRSAEQLAGLLLENKVPINQLKTLGDARNSLVANSGYAALVLSNALDAEQNPESNTQQN